MIHAMPLDRGWRIVVRFAIIGFSIGSLAAFLIATYVPGLFATVFVIVCPGMLLTYPEMWVVGWGKLPESFYGGSSQHGDLYDSRSNHRRADDEAQNSKASYVIVLTYPSRFARVV
jgi:S-formylglutathione hydrolase FrmB